jgi:hypothetical protein
LLDKVSVIISIVITIHVLSRDELDAVDAVDVHLGSIGGRHQCRHCDEGNDAKK